MAGRARAGSMCLEVWARSWPLSLLASVLCAEGFRAVGARGVGAEDFELGGKERQLLQRTRHRRIVRMPLDVGVEHGGNEAPVELIALELGHVHPVCGKATHGLVERGRHVPYAEQKGGD